jgi:hypothetical protein
MPRDTPGRGSVTRNARLKALLEQHAERNIERRDDGHGRRERRRSALQ